MAHANARLTEFGRLLLVQRITELGWPPAQAAEALGVSRATAYKWLARYRQHGQAGWPTDPRGRIAALTPSPPPRSVGCWPPGGVAARVPIGLATT
jgi:transposase-like protein